MSDNRSLTILETALIAIVILVLSPGGWAAIKYKTLYAFTRSQGGGAEPSADLIFDQAGNLYGTTQGAGDFGAGTVSD